MAWYTKKAERTIMEFDYSGKDNAEATKDLVGEIYQNLGIGTAKRVGVGALGFAAIGIGSRLLGLEGQEAGIAYLIGLAPLGYALYNLIGWTKMQFRKEELAEGVEVIVNKEIAKEIARN